MTGAELAALRDRVQRSFGGEPVDVADRISDLRRWAETRLRDEDAREHSQYVATCALAVVDELERLRAAVEQGR